LVAVEIIFWCIVVLSNIDGFYSAKDAMLSGEFEEVDGESEERRRARWDRHQRTRDRMVCLTSNHFFQSFIKCD
jgi:hypothetical protein